MAAFGEGEPGGGTDASRASERASDKQTMGEWGGGSNRGESGMTSDTRVGVAAFEPQDADVGSGATLDS